MTMADRIIAFNKSLSFNCILPDGIRIMNPFVENENALQTSCAFYQKFYSDTRKRHMILGINPGRFGAGLTGVPFTDPKRLKDVCEIDMYDGPSAHEPSSVFVYDVIARYGGTRRFYGDFYINSICPLGFVTEKANGKEVNYNYYDSRALTEAVQGFILETFQKQLDLGIHRDVCFCLGTGKNFAFIQEINKAHGFFSRIEPLEHPRYVIQYKSKSMPEYADKYVRLLRACAPAEN